MTTNSFMKKISTNTNLSPVEMKSLIGKPRSEENHENGITLLEYRDAWTFSPLAALFTDDKLIYYGSYNKYSFLDALYEHDVIDHEYYKTTYNEHLQKDEYNQRMSLMRAQERSIRKQARYQKEMLEIEEQRNAREKKESFRRSLDSIGGDYTSGTIRNTRTGEMYSYDSYSY